MNFHLNFCSSHNWGIYYKRPKRNLCFNSKLCCKLGVIVGCRSSNVVIKPIDQNIKISSVINFAEWDKDEEVNVTKNVIV